MCALLILNLLEKKSLQMPRLARHRRDQGSPSVGSPKTLCSLGRQWMWEHWAFSVSGQRTGLGLCRCLIWWEEIWTTNPGRLYLLLGSGNPSLYRIAHRACSSEMKSFICLCLGLPLPWHMGALQPLFCSKLAGHPLQLSLEPSQFPFILAWSHVVCLPIEASGSLAMGSAPLFSAPPPDSFHSALSNQEQIIQANDFSQQKKIKSRRKQKESHLPFENDVQCIHVQVQTQTHRHTQSYNYYLITDMSFYSFIICSVSQKKTNKKQQKTKTKNKVTLNNWDVWNWSPKIWGLNMETRTSQGKSFMWVWTGVDTFHFDQGRQGQKGDRMCYEGQHSLASWGEARKSFTWNGRTI